MRTVHDDEVQTMTEAIDRVRGSMTYKTWAELNHFHASQVSRWRRGKGRPRGREEYARLADALEVSIDHLGILLIRAEMSAGAGVDVERGAARELRRVPPKDRGAGARRAGPA